MNDNDVIAFGIDAKFAHLLSEVKAMDCGSLMRTVNSTCDSWPCSRPIHAYSTSDVDAIDTDGESVLNSSSTFCRTMEAVVSKDPFTKQDPLANLVRKHLIHSMEDLRKPIMTDMSYQPSSGK